MRTGPIGHKSGGMFGDDRSLYDRLRDSHNEGTWPGDQRHRKGGQIAVGYLLEEYQEDPDLSPGELLAQIRDLPDLGATGAGAEEALRLANVETTWEHWVAVFERYGGRAVEPTKGCG